MRLAVSVRKQLGAFAVDADFASDDGVIALFGRSGAGKTSIVSMIAGLLKPDSGRIAIGETPLFDSAAGLNVPAYRRRIGYVFQEGRLFPHLSVRSNLLYGHRLARKADRLLKLDQVVALLGIEPLLRRRPEALSGGEKQRVAIGRALLSAPRLLLLDEPLASLDAERRNEILPYLERLRDEMRLPMVLVSHAIPEVARLADRVAFIADGKIVAQGSVDDVFSRLDLKPLVGDFEASSLLTARIVVHDLKLGVTRLEHPAGTLSVPLIKGAAGSHVRVRVRSRDVSVVVGEVGRLSIRNRLAATVLEIAEAEPPAVDLRLNVGGQRLLARITRDALADLGLAAGQKVTALIKSIALDRGGES
ncbi:MAG: molybdenum ABC transporter ATP-binding protein [Bauldia sp.]